MQEHPCQALHIIKAPVLHLLECSLNVCLCQPDKDEAHRAYVLKWQRCPVQSGATTAADIRACTDQDCHECAAQTSQDVSCEGCYPHKACLLVFCTAFRPQL